jgi:AraC family transcriptional regulator, positive regulator of tynA and feaB
MPRMDVYFDAGSIPVSRRLAHWQELVGDHLAGVEMRRPSNIPVQRAFSGSMTLHAYENATFATVRSANQLLTRTPQRIRAAQRETVLINIVLAGECHIAQDDKCVVLRAGDLCLYESVRPYEISAPGAFETLVVMVDRDIVEASLGNLRGLTALPVHAGESVGFIAHRFWQDFASRVGDLNEDVFQRLIRCGFDMIGAALTPKIGAALPQGLSSAFALQRAKAFMARNSHRAELPLVEIAGASGLSVRRLQELFQAEGDTISDHLRRIRMTAAGIRLAQDSLGRQPIWAIMQSVGFSDQAQFSRAFRRAFGVSPRAYRSGARA